MTNTASRVEPPRQRRRWAVVVAITVVALVLAVWGAVASEDELTVADAVVLGVVEGVTEYLPISSTGHLTVTERLLGIGDAGVEKEAADAYAIVIQAGAILAVLGLYRRRVSAMTEGLVGRSAEGRRLVTAVAAAFVPAAVIGLTFEEVIKDRLFGVGPVVLAWAAGGVAILVLAPRWSRGIRPLEGIGPAQGLVIGLAQVLALWPGVSRSLVTILAAMALGYAVAAAVEFSFLLGLVTLGAATAYEAVTSWDILIDEFGLTALVVGLVVSLLSAVAAVRWMVAYLNRHGLEIFGWYRLAIAGVVGSLMLTTVLKPVL